MMFTGVEKDMEIVLTKGLSKPVSFHQVEKVNMHGAGMYRVMSFGQDLRKFLNLLVSQGIQATCQIPVRAEVKAPGAVLSEQAEGLRIMASQFLFGDRVLELTWVITAVIFGGKAKH